MKHVPTVSRSSGSHSLRGPDPAPGNGVSGLPTAEAASESPWHLRTRGKASSSACHRPLARRSPRGRVVSSRVAHGRSAPGRAVRAGRHDARQVRAIADAVLYEDYLLYPYRPSSAKKQSAVAVAACSVRPARAARQLRRGTRHGVPVPPHLSRERHGRPGLAEAAAAVPAPSGPLGRAGRRGGVRRCRGAHRRTVGPSSAGTKRSSASSRCRRSTSDRARRPRPRAVVWLGSRSRVPWRSSRSSADGRARRPAGSFAGAGRCGSRSRSRLGSTTGSPRSPVGVDNVSSREVHCKEEAIRGSLIGTHALVVAEGAEFVSLLDPPAEAAAAAGRCTQDRCHPVLVGPPWIQRRDAGIADHPESRP